MKYFYMVTGALKVNLYINDSPAPAVTKNVILRPARWVAPGVLRAVRVKILKVD